MSKRDVQKKAVLRLLDSVDHTPILLANGDPCPCIVCAVRRVYEKTA